MRNGLALLLLFLVGSPLWAADVLDISNEAELDAAIIQAASGDTLALDAGFAITAAKDIPAGVTLDGNGFTVSSPGTNYMLAQHSANALVRDASLISTNYGGWRIGAYSRIRFENCYINARTIAWANGQIELQDCVVEVVIPVPPDSTLRFTEPIMVQGSSTELASLTATNCFFHLGWTGTGPSNSGRHNDHGLFDNYGGNPSTISISHCTIIGATDWVSDRTDSQLAVFKSRADTGPDYITEVSNSVIIADASSIFWSTGSGTVTSRYNNNAGMTRNPLVLRGTEPDAPNFYFYHATDTAVSDKTGDTEEFNPFVDVLNGDYRLVESSDSATGAEGGGAMGADLGVLEMAQNAYNLDFNLHDNVSFLLPLHDEELFYGWKIHRGVDDQFFFGTSSGLSGRAMRFEAQDTSLETGGDAHDVTVVQSAYQTFVTIPGYRYTIGAFSRRRASDGHSWASNGQYGMPAIGVSDGVVTDPTSSDQIVVVSGPEDSWTWGSVTFLALSNHITVHLIHATNGSWNIGDWDSVIISGAPASVPTGVDTFEMFD